MPISSIVSRSTNVLDLICSSGRALTFTEVVTRSGLPKSSAHRILMILAEEGLVTLDAARQVYQPGERLIGWAASVLRTNDLPTLAASAMEDLSRRAKGHVALSILDGTNVLYLKTIDRGVPFRLTPRVGEHSPAHACAAGKVLLAHLGEDRLKSVMARMKLEPCTDRTITSHRLLAEEIETVRQDGYALCDREEFLQVAGVAAPVFNHLGQAVAAVSLWNEVERQDIDALKGQLANLVEATGALSARIGFTPE